MSYKYRLIIATVVFIIGFCIVVTDVVLGIITTTEGVLNLIIALITACIAYYIPLIIQ